MTLNAIVLPSLSRNFHALVGNCDQILAGWETYTLIAQAKEDAGNSSNWLRNSPLEKICSLVILALSDLIRAISKISTLYQPRFLSKYNSLSDLTPALTLACHDISCLLIRRAQVLLSNGEFLVGDGKSRIARLSRSHRQSHLRLVKWRLE